MGTLPLSKKYFLVMTHKCWKGGQSRLHKTKDRSRMTRRIQGLELWLNRKAIYKYTVDKTWSLKRSETFIFPFSTVIRTWILRLFDFPLYLHTLYLKFFSMITHLSSYLLLDFLVSITLLTKFRPTITIEI